MYNPTDKYPSSCMPLCCAVATQKMVSFLSYHLSLLGNYCVVLVFYCANTRSTTKQRSFWNEIKRECIRIIQDTG